MDLLDFSEQAPAPAPPPVPSTSLAMILDPFSQAPSPSLTPPPIFSYQSIPLVPLKYTTPQFGGEWGTLASTSPCSIATPPSFSLDISLSKLKSVGLHVVESIPSTVEVIAAGEWNGQVVLVHCKINSSSGKADITVKCENNELGASL